MALSWGGRLAVFVYCYLDLERCVDCLLCAAYRYCFGVVGWWGLIVWWVLALGLSLTYLEFVVISVCDGLLVGGFALF